MEIIKRNGQKVEFDKGKILNAISKANNEAKNNNEKHIEIPLLDCIVTMVTEDIKAFNRDVNVEEIQDIVENTISELGFYDVCKRYIRYRYKRELLRNKYAELMDAVKEKISAEKIVNQNANVDEQSFGGRLGETSNLIMEKYALDYCMSKKSKENHLNNEIYIHDLSSYPIGSHNCISIPFDKLLKNGFKTRQTDIRPAQSVSTAAQLIAVIIQLQSLQQFGGCSATHIDWTMVPYIRKSFLKHYKDGLAYIESAKAGYQIKIALDSDVCVHYSIDDINIYRYKDAYKYAMYMTKKEIYQAVEGIYHNLNTLQSRSGNQLPFSSINYGTCTLKEGRLFTKALLDVSINGIGTFHETSVFPCGIFKCKKGINLKKGDANYDLFQLALKSTSQRLYPNYANCDWSGNKGYDINNPAEEFSTMGCRTANGFDINGLGYLKDGRGNICPVTIILPTLAMMANGDVKNKDINSFMKILKNKISEAKEMLIERFEWICSQNPNSASFMYDNNIMAGYDGKDIRSALKHGTLAIGQIGLAETLQILIGYNHTTERGMELAKKIEQMFKNKCKKYKEEYKLNFGVYYTPAENLCYTAMQKFKDKYGIIENISDKEFFTNSMHVPVWEKIGVFDKINIEAKLTGYSSAGCITYVELDSTVKNNIEALETIITYAMENDIPYFAINVPNDMCQKCGYTDEINDKCPMCGESENIRRLRRVTGYLSNDYHHFNQGKIQEVEMRVKHGGCTL